MNKHAYTHVCIHIQEFPGSTEMFSTKLKLTGTYSHCTEVVHDHDIIVLFLCMHHTGLKYFRVCQAAPVSEIITTKFSKLYIHAGMHACYFILTYNTYIIKNYYYIDM